MAALVRLETTRLFPLDGLADNERSLLRSEPGGGRQRPTMESRGVRLIVVPSPPRCRLVQAIQSPPRAPQRATGRPQLDAADTDAGDNKVQALPRHGSSRPSRG